MHPITLLALSVVLMPRLVNAQEAGPSVSQPSAETASAPSATVNDIVNMALEVGEDRVDFKDRGAPYLGFKEKHGIRNRGGGVKAKSTPDMATRSCHVALKETRRDLQPQCIILTWLKVYPEDKHSVEYAFRFDLAGKLEKAFRSTGKITETGEGVKGSAILTALKVKDPEVQQRAREELDFWLKRTAKYLAKKRAKEQAALGGGGASVQTSSVQAARDTVAEPAASAASPSTAAEATRTAAEVKPVQAVSAQ